MTDGSSIGEQLQAARTKKNLSIEQVSRDIFISIRLLNALEAERYEEFTSEVYLVGFLKSYADYLDLNSDQIAERFRNIRLQEQPTPISELLQREGSSKKVALIVVSVACAALIGFGLLFLGQSGTLDSLAPFVKSGTGQSGADVALAGTIYSLEDGFLEREFAAGDSIRISRDEPRYIIHITKIARSVVLDFQGERFTLRNSERIIVPLDQSIGERAEVLVRDILRQREPVRATLRVVRRRDAQQVVEDTTVDNQAVAYGNTKIAARRRVPTNLGQHELLTTFPVQMSFTAPVFLQYQVDDQQQVAQLYGFQDVVTLNPRERLMVWATNAGAINFNVLNRFIPIGTLGMVTSFVVEKSADSSTNRNTLRITPLY